MFITVLSHITTQLYGGAINNGDDGALTVNNSTFDNNTGIYGGVIWNSGYSSTLTNNIFTNNKELWWCYLQ